MPPESCRKGGGVHRQANAVFLESTSVKPRLKFHFRVHPPLVLLTVAAPLLAAWVPAAK